MRINLLAAFAKKMAAAGLLGFAVLAAPASAQLPAPQKTMAIIDGTQNFGAYRRSVAYYDTSQLTNAANDSTLTGGTLGKEDTFGNVPMFAVWLGSENPGLNFDEADALAVNPFSGDTYVVAFDSGTEGSTDAGSGDIDGDADLYRIDYSQIKNLWDADPRDPNISVFDDPLVGKRGQMYAPGADFINPVQVSGHPDHNGFEAPNGPYPAGTRSTINLSGPDGIAKNGDDPVQKIGQVVRPSSSDTFPPGFDGDLEFVDPATLVWLTPQDGPNGADTPENDHQIRVVSRLAKDNVSAPGFTNGAVEGLDRGGFNSAPAHGQTESWESYTLATISQDFTGVGGSLVGRSEPRDIAFVEKDGRMGVWVLEGDGGGDDIAFFEIVDITAQGTPGGSGEVVGVAGNGYATINGLGTSRALDEDPEFDVNNNTGEADFIAIDRDGNVLLGESNFFDVVLGGEFGSDDPAQITAGEPTYLRFNVDEYQAGNVVTTGGGVAGSDTWDDLGPNEGFGPVGSDTAGDDAAGALGALEGPAAQNPLSNAITGGTGLSQDDDLFVTDGRFSVIQRGGQIDLNGDGVYSAADGEIFTGDLLFLFDIDGGAGSDDDLLGGQASSEQVITDIYVVDLETGQIVYEEIDGLNHFVLEPGGFKYFMRGDSNDDGLFSAEDIEALVDASNGGALDEEEFDLDGDDAVTLGVEGSGTDLELLVQEVIGTEFGDGNVDGFVDNVDFSLVAGNFNGVGGWGDGDFNGDGVVDNADFSILAGNFGFNASAPAAPVAATPEPATAVFVLIAAATGVGFCRRRGK